MNLDIGRVFSDATGSITGRFGGQVGVWGVFFTLFIGVILAFVFGVSGAAQYLTPDALRGNPFAGMEGGFIFALFLVYLVLLLIKDAGFAAQCSISTPLRETSVGEAIGDGFRSALSLLVVTVITVIGFVLLLFLIGLISGSGGSGFLGLLLILAALSVAAVKLGMTWPIVAIDGERNPISAMARAWSMTNGNFWLVWVCYVIWFIANIAIGLGLAFGVAAPMTASVGVPGLATIIILVVIYLAYYAFYWLSLVSITTAIHGQLSSKMTERLDETFQ